MMFVGRGRRRARAADRRASECLCRRADVMTGANEQAPKILDVPIGLGATGMRQEFDSLGTAEVPAAAVRVPGRGQAGGRTIR